MGRRSEAPGVDPDSLLRRLGLLLFLPALLVLGACGSLLPGPVAPAVLGGEAPPPGRPTGGPAEAWPVTIGCEAAVPGVLRARLEAIARRDPARFAWTEDPALADLRLTIGGPPSAVPVGIWTYAVAAPFWTVEDEVASADLVAAWRGAHLGSLAAHPLLAAADTLQALTTLWGPPAPTVRAVDPAALLAEAKGTGGWAIVPFDELQTGWKVLRVGGISLLEKGLQGNLTVSYPVQLPLALASERRADALPLLAQALGDLSNRQEGRMTVVAMTGTTALTRSTAQAMETRGLAHPARDIQEWLVSADFTHVSNEVSFTPDCRVPPNEDTMTFCAHERYIALLEAVGTDIVELTGNHLLDYGPEPLRHSLEMFRQRGWRWYGGGENLAEATRPLTIVQGPNRLAFLGANPVGPAYDWATAESPGSAPCDYERLKAQIRELRAAGYLPIVTLQYQESYQYFPTPEQIIDFRALAEAGAAVVQGSQAHQPQAMELYGDAFIHYGLGNLFFDQMQWLGTRQEFVDRLVFYDGRLLSIDLRTALLEEYARPRPMTGNERRAFLQLIFDLRP